MKTSLLLKVIVISIITTVISNYSYSQIRYGIKAGYNLSTTIHKTLSEGDYIDYEKADLKSISGFHSGGMLQIDFGKYIAFQPAILLTTRGYKAEEKSLKTTSLNYYVNIPLNVIGKYSFNDITVFGFVGPSLYYGFAGKTKMTYYTSTGEMLSTTYYKTFRHNDVDDFGNYEVNSHDSFKRFDLGLDMGIGAEFIGNLQVCLHYDLGLLNIDRSKYITTPPAISKQGNFMVSVGWLFNKKEKQGEKTAIPEL
ncbi:MAG: porin family protein [Bacteroidales bacterium]|jgi:hypothetical protein|nr:PorT family protein [Bacteroidales bacterium]MDD2204327.1 porin family protein [Bacteroidales bacterium]MDD3152121.1 porin family protein [Bacteroidales bacterium]MDD3913208.1 porin family protein [Bacteroidales bacterium]MDD4633123.1 porin family protein [Bacteroidales bacterium]